MSDERKDAIALQLGDKFYVLPKADADKYLVDQSTFAKYSESSDVEGQGPICHMKYNKS